MAPVNDVVGVGVTARTGASASARITLSAASGCICRNEIKITLFANYFSFLTATVLVFVRFVSRNFSFYFVFVLLITVILVLVFWKRRPIILVLVLIFVTKITDTRPQLLACSGMYVVSFVVFSLSPNEMNLNDHFVVGSYANTSHVFVYVLALWQNYKFAGLGIYSAWQKLPWDFLPI